MITDAKARAIATDWYDGQWSGLYKIVCNKDYAVLTIAHWGDAYREALRESALNRGPDRRALNALAEWIAYRARGYGCIVTVSGDPVGARPAPLW